MTRKRFVKLLMSKGVSRNQANGIAQQYISEGLSYESGYRIWKIAHSLKDPMTQIGEVVNRATAAIQSLASAIGAAASAFSSVLSVSLQQPSPFGGRCPVCDWFVGEQVDIFGRKHNQQKKNFCDRCGQMIDWEGVEHDAGRSDCAAE